MACAETRWIDPRLALVQHLYPIGVDPTCRVDHNLRMTKCPVTVAELGTFLRSATAAGMTDEERAELVDHLARNPLAGDLIKDTGGLRKLRWARAGGGQSGGYRAVYYFYDEAAPIYAVYAYGKNQRADLSAEQRKAASRFIAEIKLAIKAGRLKRSTT